MINEENKTEIIEQYLEGNLDDELRLEVEERIKNDEKFGQEVFMQQQIVRTVQRMQRDTIRKELAEISESDDLKLSDTPVVPFYQRSLFYIAAASIVLLTVAGIFVWINQKTPTQTFQGVVAVEVERMRGESTVPDSLVLTIIKHPDYDFHYQLGDTLTLYGNFLPTEITVHYVDDEYELQIEGRSYSLVNDNTIRLLRR